MNRQQAEQFIAIYNALMTISTRGEDTKTMGQVLQMMEELANSIEVVDPQVPDYNFEPVVEEMETEGE